MTSATPSTPLTRRARFHGEGQITYEDVPVPVPGPGESLLRVAVTGLCGSDKRLLRTGVAVVPGHEIAGEVISMGDHTDLRNGAKGEASIQVGQRALVYIPVFCGECDQCRRGQTNRCLRLTELIGWQRDGGYAEHVVVPTRCLLPIPDDVPYDVAVLGLDTVGTAAHGLRLALRTQPDGVRDIAVIGCGPLGLGVVAVIAAMGLPRPYAYDPHPGRLKSAGDLGATPLTDLDSVNQVDLAVEVSGAGPAREIAQRIVRPGGVVLALGESDDPYTMPATPRWRRTDCFTVRSFYFPLTDVDANWGLLRANGAQLRDQLCVPVTLDDLPAAFQRFLAGDYLKPCIIFREES